MAGCKAGRRRKLSTWTEKDGRWVPAKPLPYYPSLRERIIAAVMAFRGKGVWWLEMMKPRRG